MDWDQAEVSIDERQERNTFTFIGTFTYTLNITITIPIQETRGSASTTPLATQTSHKPLSISEQTPPKSISRDRREWEIWEDGSP